MKIIVEVGANNGEDTDHLLGGADKLYACEPDPELFSGLIEKFKDNPRVTLWPVAITLENGCQDLNISLGERGINSLYELHPNLLNTALQKHKVYQDGFQKKVPVWTARLDTLMALYNIPHIDFLWIDAQGNDLIALKSLGDRIKDVSEGRCECTYKVPLYEGVDNSYESTVAFLESQGFKHWIDYTHADDSEVDVKFSREFLIYSTEHK